MNYLPQLCGDCFIFSPQGNKLSKLVISAHGHQPGSTIDKRSNSLILFSLIF